MLKNWLKLIKMGHKRVETMNVENGQIRLKTIRLELIGKRLKTDQKLLLMVEVGQKVV
jgi:hypothetical protein